MGAMMVMIIFCFSVTVAFLLLGGVKMYFRPEPPARKGGRK